MGLVARVTRVRWLRGPRSCLVGSCPIVTLGAFSGPVAHGPTPVASICIRWLAWLSWPPGLLVLVGMAIPIPGLPGLGIALPVSLISHFLPTDTFHMSQLVAVSTPDLGRTCLYLHPFLCRYPFIPCCQAELNLSHGDVSFLNGTGLLYSPLGLNSGQNWGIVSLTAEIAEEKYNNLMLFILVSNQL